jgi:hypothetical protein
LAKGNLRIVNIIATSELASALYFLKL